METVNTSNYPITITSDISGATSILATTLTLLPLRQWTISSEFDRRISSFADNPVKFHYGIALSKVLIKLLIFLTAVLPELVLAVSDPTSPEG